MKIRTKTIENLKTLLIVVLIASAILLLYFLWQNESFDDLRSPIELLSEAKGSAAPSDPAEFIVPDSIIAKLEESQSYKVSTDRLSEYWRMFIVQFRQFSAAEDVYVEEIKQEQWEQAQSMTSLMAAFRYDIDFTAFCSLFDISQPVSYSTIESVSVLLYLQGSEEGIILYDRKNDKYYRLASQTSPGQFSSIIQAMAGTETQPATETDDYYPMGPEGPLGIEVNNDCLIPADAYAGAHEDCSHSQMRRVAYQPEIQNDAASDETNSIEKTAQLFFGQTFDFIRRVRETNNTTVFIYGYGEKRLSSQQNGSFEYREEYLGGGAEESFDQALQTSTAYIDSHGGFSALKEKGISAYVKNVSSIEEKNKKGYRITFGLKLQGMPVYHNHEDAMIVDTIGGQVIYYKRYTVVPAEAEEDQAEAAPAVMGAISVLIKNSENGSIQYMLERTRQDEASQAAAVPSDREKSLNAAVPLSEIAGLAGVANSIDEIRAGYWQSKEQGELLPVWVFTAGSADMYFDLYTGEPYGFIEHEK